MSLSSKYAKTAAIAALMVVASGCAWIPSSGPIASTIKSDHPNVRLVKVSPEMAQQLWNQTRARQQAKVHSALLALQRQGNSTPALKPGDEFKVTLWFLSILNSGEGSSGSKSAFQKLALGTYTVSNKGNVTLPWVGTINLAGKSIDNANKIITIKYKRSGVFADPQTHLQWVLNRGQQVLVTGFARKPVAISWHSGGVTIAQALTKAEGALSGIATNKGQISEGRSVEVLEPGLAKQFLPLGVAQTSNIKLIPGTRIFISEQAPIQVYCLGGGWRSAHKLQFSAVPTLSKVMASASLSASRANARYIFVLSGNHHVVYEVPYSKLDNMIALRQFPVQNNAVVYIATAKSFRLQQIVSLLFTPFYPAAVAKGAF